MRHLCCQLRLQNAGDAAPLLKCNSGALGWAERSIGAAKKPRHAGMPKMHAREAMAPGGVGCYCVIRKEHPADLCTKEHQDLAQFRASRGLAAMPREGFIAAEAAAWLRPCGVLEFQILIHAYMLLLAPYKHTL